MIINSLDQRIHSLLKVEPRTFKNELTARVTSVASSLLFPIEAAARVIAVPFLVGLYVIFTPISLVSNIYRYLTDPDAQFKFIKGQQYGLRSFVFEPTVMAIVTIANTILSPFVGLISPDAMLRMHVDSGITTFPKPAPPEPQSNLPDAVDDFVGMEELHKKFDNYLKVLKDPEGAKNYGVKFPAGMFLHGPPGCGKTYTVKHLCHYAKSQGVELNYLQIKGSDVASEWRGVTVVKIHKLFSEAQKMAPCLVFIDECEGLFPSRDGFKSTYGAERTQELNEMLQQIEEAKNNRIIVVAATNHLSSVDSAIFRTGRFDYSFEVKPPTEALRLKMFEAKLHGKKCDPALDLSDVVKATEGFTASDIETIVNEAGYTAWDTGSLISREILLASAESIAKKKSSVAKGPQDEPRQAPLMQNLKTGLDALRELVGSVDTQNPQSLSRE